MRRSKLCDPTYDVAPVIRGPVPLLLLGLLCGCLVTAAAAPAQQTGASRTALVAITDAKDRVIVDVGADDVAVQEAGQPREVLSVRVADYPVLVMFDNGSDARTDFEMLRKAAARFVERLGPRPMALGTLADPPRVVTAFEDEPAVLMKAVAALAVDPAAKSAMMQAAALGGRTLRASGSLFSGLVILSATGLDASSGNPDELVANVVDSAAIVHVVANRSVALTAAPGQMRTGMILRSLAQQTRGEYTVIYSPASYQAALDRLADRLVGELMVEYLVPPGSKPLDVTVGVRLPGARIRGLGVAPR